MPASFDHVSGKWAAHTGCEEPDLMSAYVFSSEEDALAALEFATDAYWLASDFSPFSGGPALTAAEGDAGS